MEYVRNTVYNGVYNGNQLNFEHFNLSNIAVHIDDQSDTVPFLDQDFTKSLYLKCFHSMFGSSGKVNADEDFDVSRTEYDNGYTLYRLSCQQTMIHYLCCINEAHRFEIRRGTRAHHQRHCVHRA